MLFCVVKIQTIQHFIPQSMAAHLHKQGQYFLKGQFSVTAEVLSWLAAESIGMLRHIPNYGVQRMFYMSRIVFRR